MLSNANAKQFEFLEIFFLSMLKLNGDADYVVVW